MSNNSSRREWLRNTTAALAGISLAPTIFATEKERYRAEGIILLNGNENPYGPSDAARKAMTEAVGNSNRYPDDAVHALRQQLAEFNGVEKENILMGAGSSEIIGLVLLAVGGGNRRGYIMTAEPSYKIWHTQAEVIGYDFIQIPLNKERKYDLDKFSSYQSKFNAQLFYICNPNNPTGTFVEPKKLEDFINNSRSGHVLVDEAYTEYPDIPSLAQYAIKVPKVIVAKTFSKIYGLAGARIGYAIAHPETIKKLASLQAWPNANVSMVTATAASAALKDQEFVKDCREKAALARQMCYDCFKELSLEYIPSHANFILFNIDKVTGDFTKRMEEKKIFVQFRNHFGGKWCRVSMGTIDEMKAFCTAIKEIA